MGGLGGAVFACLGRGPRLTWDEESHRRGVAPAELCFGKCTCTAGFHRVRRGAAAWLGGVGSSEAEGMRLGSGQHGARWPRTEPNAWEPVSAPEDSTGSGRKGGPRESLGAQ